DEADRSAVRLALALRELEQVQRPFDVDMMRGDRRELRARRQQGREVEDAVDLELREDAIEHRGVGDRSSELARDGRRERRLEPADVDGDERGSCCRKARDEAVADLAARARNENDRFTHSTPPPLLPSPPAPPALPA